MSLSTKKYVRRPLHVEAVQITEENRAEVAKWCGGKVVTDKNGKTFISLEVPYARDKRQCEGHLGDWVLRATNSNSDRGVKIYTDHAFRRCFDELASSPRPSTKRPAPKPKKPSTADITPNNLDDAA